ncbi:MAG: VWA domain-containing protein [Thermodesulfobacteriota bacterium]
MKKLWLAMTALLVMLTAGPVVGQEAFYPGEGYVTPSDKANEPFISHETRQNGTSENVNVSVVSQDFPNIVLNVTVRDDEGNPVTDLTIDDFTVTEQAGPEPAPVDETLTCFEETRPEGDIAFSLVFDVSDSMGLQNRLPDAKDAAIDFLNTTLPGDRGALVSFSGCNQTEIVLPLTGVREDTDGNGTSDFVEAIQSLTTIDLTAVFDGIAMGIDSISEASFPKGVIAFSDGNTNADCEYTINELIQKAQEAGIPVYTVGLEIEPNSDMAQRLQEIANETGGFYTPAPTAADMAEIYQDIAQVIRSQYRLCYTTHNPVQDGTTRTVRVTTDGQTGTGAYTVGQGPAPDNRPPVIDHTPVDTATEGTPIPLSAQVTDPDGNLSQTILFYRTSNPESPFPYTSIEMNLAGDGNTFQADIPAESVGLSGVEYYIEAGDTLDAESQTGNPADPFFIQVVPADQPPVADAGPDMSVDEGAPVVLDGAGSFNPNPEDTLTYEWVQTGGPAVVLSDPTAPQPTFTAPSVGPEGAVLTFDLTVGDGTGSSTDTVSVTVNDTLAPVADFTWAPETPETGETVSFMDLSSAAAAPIVDRTWTFGELGAGSGAAPVFTFPDSGAYTVELQVTDEDGSTGTTVRTITVVEPPCVEGDCGGGSGGCFIDATRSEAGLGLRERLLRIVHFYADIHVGSAIGGDR